MALCPLVRLALIVYRFPYSGHTFVYRAVCQVLFIVRSGPHVKFVVSLRVLVILSSCIRHSFGLGVC